jgi:anti-sigma regulatory factor (Ser/Thr protein kinase)
LNGSIPQAEHPLALELPARPASVTHARRTAASFAASCGADPAAVELAVGEAVGNAVLHAYRGDASGEIRVDGAMHEGTLVIVVGDDGVGMRPDPSSRGLGFGLPLIAQLASAVEITGSDEGGTEVRMRFEIPEERG